MEAQRIQVSLRTFATAAVFILFAIISIQGVGRFWAADDSRYMLPALELWRGTPFPIAFTDYGRPVLIWLTWAFRWVVPSLYWSSVAAALSITFAALWIILKGTGRVFDASKDAGIVAALALITCPVFMTDATYLMPDSFAGSFALMGVFLYAYSLQQKTSAFAGVSVGLLLGLACLSKQTAIFLGLPLAVHLLVMICVIKSESRWRLVKFGLWIALGGTGLLLLYFGYCAIVYHDWLHILNWPKRVASVDITSRDPYRANRWNFILMFFGRDFAYFGWLYLLASIATLLSNWRNPIAWCGLGYLSYLLFGSVSLTSYVPTWFQPRYIVAVIPFLAVCFGLQIDRMLSWFAQCTKHATLINGLYCRLAPGILLGVFFGVLAGFCILTIPPDFPVWRRQEFIMKTAYDNEVPIYVSERFKRKHDLILPTSASSRLHAIDPTSDVADLPDNYRLLIDAFEFNTNRWPNVPWTQSKSRGNHFEVYGLRRFLDILRGLKEDRYRSYYLPILYEVTVSATLEDEKEDERPPWEVAKSTPLGQRGEL